MKLKQKKPIVIALVITIVFLLLTELFRLILAREVPGADFNLAYRKIETTDKLVLNGMLGHFFRFSVFGILNVLILPFLFRDLFRFRKLEQWQKTFLFIYCCVLLVVGLKGYFNPRYTLTLYPISIGYLFYSLWHFFKEKQRPAYLKIIPFILVFLAVYDFGRKIVMREPYEEFSQEHLYSQEYKGYKNGDNIEMKITRITSARGMLNAILYENLPDYKHNPDFYNDYPNLSQRKIFEYVNRNHRKGGKRVLANNLPAIYHYTDAYCVFYWCGEDIVYDDKGQWHLFENRDLDQVQRYLLDSMNVGFIYTYEPYNNYNPDFHQFLHEKCVIVEQTFNTYQLFKIRE